MQLPGRAHGKLAQVAEYYSWRPSTLERRQEWSWVEDETSGSNSTVVSADDGFSYAVLDVRNVRCTYFRIPNYLFRFVFELYKMS